MQTRPVKARAKRANVKVANSHLDFSGGGGGGGGAAAAASS